MMFAVPDGASTPTLLLGELSTSTPWLPLAIAELPAMLVPIVLPMTSVPPVPPGTRTPTPLLPEITFPVPTVFAPAPETVTPLPVFPTVPAASPRRPMKLFFTTLLLADAPVMATPAASLPPMMFESTVFDATFWMVTPLLPLPLSRLPLLSVPIRFPTIVFEPPVTRIPLPPLLEITLRCAPEPPMVLPLELTTMPLPPKLLTIRLRTTQPFAPRVRPWPPAPAELPLSVTAPIVVGWMVVGWVRVGRALRGEIVPETLKLIVWAPPPPFAAVMAARSEPLPVSFVLLTVNVAASAALPARAIRTTVAQTVRVIDSSSLRDDEFHSPIMPHLPAGESRFRLAPSLPAVVYLWAPRKRWLG